MLQPTSTSKHNVMRGQKIPHPKSTHFDGSSDIDDAENHPRSRATKRPRHNRAEPATPGGKKRFERTTIPDSEEDTDPDINDGPQSNRQTDLETALPAIQPDDETIAAYETARAAGEVEGVSKITPSQESADGQTWTPGRSSIYVDAFNLALETVLEEEGHLFDEAEHLVFKQWTQLSYEPQYLYVRLFLRKTAAWHRINRLGYHNDIADLAGAIRELQRPRELPATASSPQSYPGEAQAPEGNTLDSNTFTFADRSEDCIKDLEEASSLLLLDELKAFAKEMKVSGKNKQDLLRAFRRTSGQQAGLGGFVSLRRSETNDSSASQPLNPDNDIHEDSSLHPSSTRASPSPSSPSSRTPTPSRTNRDEHFLQKILLETGPLIRLSLASLRLFERVHLVFYRSTEWTEKSLSTIILARIARRNFPEYIVSRSANIFASRHMLLEFEAALRTQFRVDSLLEFHGPPTPADFREILSVLDAVYPRWEALVTEEQEREYSVYTSGEGAYLRRLSPAWVYTRLVHKGAYVLGKMKDHRREHATLTALLAQRLFHTARRGDWYQRKALLEEHYMWQFGEDVHCGTRGVSADKQKDEKKNVRVAGTNGIKANTTEHEPPTPTTPILTPTEEAQRKKHWKRIALATCEQGLQDQLTHLIFHHDLQKRIGKLEKALKVPKRLQHEFGHATLTRPVERTFYGIRIERNNTPIARRRVSDPSSSAAPNKSDRRGAKTIWIDPAFSLPPESPPSPSNPSDSTPPPSPTPATTISPLTNPSTTATGECSVEAMCLSSYRAQGWKGYHSESGILRTLFAHLFHDLLFLYMPHVFQTAYQTCPLDLHTDAFYPARMSEVNARLNEISNGHAQGIVERSFAAHEARRTCIVGLNWDYAQEDVCEIVSVFPPSALSVVMRVLVQEYAVRGGGVPDLFLWRAGRNGGLPGEEHRDGGGELEGLPLVMFAEVKSENDRLSDTQRMWIDVLSGAGLRVELCHALASEVRSQR